jgi:hypothetical protein
LVKCTRAGAKSPNIFSAPDGAFSEVDSDIDYSFC